MNPSRFIRSILVAACVALACGPPLAMCAAPSDPAALLEQADRIKTSNHADFVDLLRRLDADPTALSRPQQDQLQYFHAWEFAFQGDDAQAIKTLRSVAAHAADPDLRLRAQGSLVNVLVNATRYQEAYALLDGLLAALPGARDPMTRQRIFAQVTQLYIDSGQNDLALRYADRMLAEAQDDPMACQAQYYRMRVYSKLPGNTFETGYPAALARCVKAHEPLYTDSIRVFVAIRFLDQGHADAARAALEPYLQEARETGFVDLVEDVDATLARAAWAQGDAVTARAHALQVMRTGRNSFAVIVASKVLYEIAKAQGDTAAALAWHEKYAIADKGYTNDVSARALAYQMVHQQVQDKKAQIAALAQQNQVLTLKQSVSRKNMLVAWLGAALLLVVASSIALYAWRTKRSQLKFQKLARRDGLTEIHNRHYFIECAEAELAYCRKSMRSVSLVAIDLDHFKQINDTHGHAAGDQALKLAVAACSQHLRSVDVFGRMGGEEFNILLPDCVPEQAADIAGKMRAQIAALHGAKGGTAFPVTASFGVSAARWSGYDLAQLLAHADSALYQAKREGRDRVVVHGTASAVPGGPPVGIPERRLA
ncbi:MAG: GGDEF domain-containing protein [Proteobacteria bacterium]|nr:GGDEF domain-containing protein [Pseudomonadota bacterium]